MSRHTHQIHPRFLCITWKIRLGMLNIFIFTLTSPRVYGTLDTPKNLAIFLQGVADNYKKGETNMKTRLISLFLVLVMVFAMLVACGDDKKPNDDDEDEDDDKGSSNVGGGGGDLDDAGDGGDVGTVPSSNWWDTLAFDKTLNIMISNATDNELTPGGERYMKGPDMKQDESGSGGGSFEKVQNAVYDRNRAAKKVLGVDLMYMYCDRTWGSVAGDIREREYSGNGTADMYCDLMYDLVHLSVEMGMFSNLLKYTKKNSAKVDGYVGGYLDITAKKGYYTDLMSDMSLSNDKQFLVASDYYLDVLRAMLVMPFNLDMYIDRIDSTDINGENLYSLVDEGEWTWDMLMGMSNVYTGTGNATLNDDNLLMALSVGGLSAVGMIYSTSFSTFNIDYVDDTVVYTLSQEARSTIDQLFQKAYAVVNTSGIVCDETTAGDVNGVIACKEAFTGGGALFAGPSMLGVIEEDAFQNMEDRLSILPVPKLSTDYEYNTAVTSRARVGAVGFHSANKVEMSALIQYMTENSAEVKDAYFDMVPVGKYMTGSGTKNMLTFIYNNIGSNKSMILDNLVLARNHEVGIEYLWSELIQENYFEGNANKVSELWNAAISAKQIVINDAIEDWYECD